MDNDVEYLFATLFAMHLSSLVQCLFQSSACFFNQVVFLLLSLSFYTVQIQFLCQVYNLLIFSSTL